MATYFISKNSLPAEGKTFGFSTEVRPSVEGIIITWKGQTKSFPGNTFCIKAVGGFPQVFPVGIPKSKTSALLWACGIAKECRFNSLAEAKEATAQKRAEFVDYVEWYRENGFIPKNSSEMIGCRIFESENSAYYIAITDRTDCGGYYDLSYWVNPNMTRKEACAYLYKHGDASRKFAFKEILDRF